MHSLLLILTLFSLASLFAEEANTSTLIAEAVELEKRAETEKGGERISTLAQAFSLRQQAKKTDKAAAVKADEVKPPAASFGKTEKDYTETKEQARKVVFNGAMAAAAALDLTGLSEPAAHADPRESEKMALVCVRWENDRRKRIRESLASLKAKAKGADVGALEESVVSAVDFYFKEASAGNLRKWRSENVK